MNRARWEQWLSGRNLVWVLLLVALALNFGLRWRLLGLPLERDEGEYAYAGQLLLQGVPPYQAVWNMKFPGVYAAYAGLMAVFGQTPEGIHEGLIVVTSLSTLLVFLLGRELLDGATGALAAFFQVLLSALPFAYGLAAHATHFAVLCVLAGAYALRRMERGGGWGWTAGSGVAFGLAVVMTQQAAVFGAVAGLWLLLGGGGRPQVTRRAAVFIAGVLAPLAVMALILAWAGVWDRFYLWTIQYAGRYVSLFSLAVAPQRFASGFGPVWDDGVWVWLAGMAGLGLLFRAGPGRRAAAWAAGLLAAGLAAATPGFYFRGHYFLLAMPGLALLNAVLVRMAGWRAGGSVAAVVGRGLAWALVFLVSADLWVRAGAVWFVDSPGRVGRLLYGPSPFAASQEIARYLAARTSPRDCVAVLGSEPQIYFLARRHAATGCMYLYPLMEPQPYSAGMRSEFVREIETNRPACVVYVNNSASWLSFVIPGQSQPGLTSITDWWQSYAARHYVLVGQVDIPADAPPRYYWGARMLARTNTEAAAVSVFARQPGRP